MLVFPHNFYRVMLMQSCGIPVGLCCRDKSVRHTGLLHQNSRAHHEAANTGLYSYTELGLTDIFRGSPHRRR